MTDGVFNDAPPAQDPATPGIDPAIAARLEAKDNYIKQLEQETAEMRRAVEEADSVRKVLEDARKAAATPPPSREATPAAQEPAKPLNEDDLVERVLKAQEQRTAKATAEANAQTVVDHLVSLYGSQEAANKVVVNRAAELGVGVNFLLDAAKTSPKAFYDIMKLQTAPTQSPAPRSDVNSVALKTHAPGVQAGSPEYYEQLRMELGNAAFYTPKIQQQRFKDMQALAAKQ